MCGVIATEVAFRIKNLDGFHFLKTLQIGRGLRVSLCTARCGPLRRLTNHDRSRRLWCILKQTRPSNINMAAEILPHVHSTEQTLDFGRPSWGHRRVWHRSRLRYVEQQWLVTVQRTWISSTYINIIWEIFADKDKDKDNQLSVSLRGHFPFTPSICCSVCRIGVSLVKLLNNLVDLPYIHHISSSETYFITDAL